MQACVPRHFARALVAASLGVAALAATGAPIFWTDWTGTDLDPGARFQGQGTITTTTSTVGVTYTNANGINFYQPSGGIDYYVNSTAVGWCSVRRCRSL
jgi:hypothetical protein